MKKLSVILFLGGLLLSAALIVLHLGPTPRNPGQDQVLSRLDLKDGANLFLMSRRTDSLLEPYSVSLFHVTPDHNCYVAFLGHDESYWWRASLRAASAEGKVEIRRSGRVTGTYSVQENTFDLPARRKFCYHAARIDGVRIPLKVPERVPEIVAKSLLNN